METVASSEANLIAEILTVVGRSRVEAVPTGEAPIAAAVEAAADRVAAVAGLQVHPADASA
ncbi:hypothetical protein NLM24_39770 [Nocardia zapadnayensis]|nr:hypothetical protein [Nocardia zapadnayensis]MCX0276671.1 hypothetical protein [Nocardia zapadnayensis]